MIRRNHGELAAKQRSRVKSSGVKRIEFSWMRRILGRIRYISRDAGGRKDESRKGHCWHNGDLELKKT